LLGLEKATTVEGSEFSDWHSITGDDEALALVDLSHDLPAFVPELSLRDFPRHSRNVALRATGRNSRPFLLLVKRRMLDPSGVLAGE
jgi:hypothetical protein